MNEKKRSKTATAPLGSSGSSLKCESKAFYNFNFSTTPNCCSSKEAEKLYILPKYHHYHDFSKPFAE